jgi:hypothetical protein
MKGWLVWGALALGTLSATDAVAAELIEDVDRLGETVMTEAEALRALAAAIDAEVAEGRLTLSADAAAAWPDGRRSWEQVRNLALQGAYGPAYKAARDLRPVLRRAFREAFDGKPSSTVTDALRAWIEAIGPRVDAMTRQIEEYPLTLEARESFHVGSALWADARKAAKKKQWDRAFRLLMDALVEMDRVVYEAYPTSR